MHWPADELASRQERSVSVGTFVCSGSQRGARELRGRGEYEIARILERCMLMLGSAEDLNALRPVHR